MDNAPFRHSKQIERMCLGAGVKICLFTARFSISESNGRVLCLKAFTKRNWRQNTQKGHFRHLGLTIDVL
ncbi:hypothetical protein HL42_7471 [Trichophyton rubrum]|nr:hypothetical protein HL42_7471 [Trichophyton rubrum]